MPLHPSNSISLSMEDAVRKVKEGMRGVLSISEEVLAKARKLGMYGASDLAAERLRALARSSIPAAHGEFNFRNDLWLFRIHDNRILDLNLLTEDDKLRSDTDTYRQTRSQLSRDARTAETSTEPRAPREDGKDDPSVTRRDPRPDRRHSRRKNAQTALRISTETRNKTIQEIADWREQHLDGVLEGLVDAARQYSDELTRADKLHAARLRPRREGLLLLITRARELMPDWPVTHEDVLKWVEQEKWLKLVD